MSVLWVLPVVIVAGGLVAIFAATCQAALAAVELRTGCAELIHVRAALVALADDAATTRQGVERLRSRPLGSDESR